MMTWYIMKPTVGLCNLINGDTGAGTYIQNMITVHDYAVCRNQECLYLMQLKKVQAASSKIINDNNLNICIVEGMQTSYASYICNHF